MQLKSSELIQKGMNKDFFAVRMQATKQTFLDSQKRKNVEM